MVSFYTEDIDFLFKKKRLTSKWIKVVAESEHKKAGNISIIFCSDKYELNINLTYLGHDYYTDVITFDYCEDNIISGDLFISIDTVRDNASYYGSTFEDELDRVIIHGVLHLIGYDDHTDDEQKVMRDKENQYLGIRSSLQ